MVWFQFRTWSALLQQNAQSLTSLLLIADVRCCQQRAQISEGSLTCIYYKFLLPSSLLLKIQSNSWICSMKDSCPHNKINFIAQNEHQTDSLIDSTEDTARKTLAQTITYAVVVLKKSVENIWNSQAHDEHGQLAIVKSTIGCSAATMLNMSWTKIRFGQVKWKS